MAKDGREDVASLANKDVFNLANLLSFMNLACGVLSIIASVQSKFTSSAVLLLASALFDYLDGFAARASKNSAIVCHGFGAHLDSLCDMVSFIVAPALFAYFVGLDSQVWIAILVIYVCAGAFRLARYNANAQAGSHDFSTASSKKGYFEGVPVTVSALFPILWLFITNTAFLNLIWGLLFPVHAALMVSKLRIKKW